MCDIFLTLSNGCSKQRNYHFAEMSPQACISNDPGLHNIETWKLYLSLNPCWNIRYVVWNDARWRMNNFSLHCQLSKNNCIFEWQLSRNMSLSTSYIPPSFNTHTAFNQQSSISHVTSVISLMPLQKEQQRKSVIIHKSLSRRFNYLTSLSLACSEQSRLG